MRKQIKAGMSFSKAAKQWHTYKKLMSNPAKKQSAYNQFIGSQMKLGKTFTQAVSMWKLAKAGKLGRKGTTRTVEKVKYKTRTVKSKPQIITRTRTIKSKPETKVVVRRIKSKPQIITRTRTIKSKPQVIIRKVRTKPKVITRTITKTKKVGLTEKEMKSLMSGLSTKTVSKVDIREAMSATDEEIAYNMVETYFKELARIGFKKQLTLDEVINSYLYALARVRREDIEMSEVAQAVRKARIRK